MDFLYTLVQISHSKSSIRGNARMFVLLYNDSLAISGVKSEGRCAYSNTLCPKSEKGGGGAYLGGINIC